MTAQLSLFAFGWTRPNEHRCDRCRYGVWQTAEPHRFYCIAPGGAGVTASNRAVRGDKCGKFVERED